MSLATLAPADGELRSVSIAVGVLDLFTDAAELGPTQVALRIGIAKSTASRMLSALAAGGMLERSGSGRYRLSLRLFQYGQLAVDRLPVRAVARPVLNDLHTTLGSMVQLGLPVTGHVLYVERIGGAGPGTRLSGELPRRVPGHSCSAGQVLAAFDPEVARATAAVQRRRHSPAAGTGSAWPQQVVDRGWVALPDETDAGLASIAAPVLLDVAGERRAVAAVCVVGPTVRLLGVRKELVAAGVCRAARRIGSALTVLAQP